MFQKEIERVPKELIRTILDHLETRPPGRTASLDIDLATYFFHLFISLDYCKYYLLGNFVYY